ncbi:unnamed protein product [Urochloa decumbens]|uniref:Aminotransferase-like plant mobile domain-containing protein n=1 Tax=Urochloa decumbens TaxID=240449 RepID=A0ABC8X152_9POAL
MLIKIVKRYNIDTKKFVFGGNELEISPYDVKCIMDLPVEGEDVKNRTRKPVDNTLFNSYKSNHKLELHTLEQNIRNSVVPDDDFKRQFVLFAIGTILAPTTKDYVDSKYLGVVENVQDLSRLNWGQFTLNHLLESIQMFTLKNQVNLQGNLALLQFWFWEHVQPHRRYGISYSSIPPPLMARWDEDSAKLRDTSFKDDQLDGGVVDMILQVMKQNQLDTEKKLSRIAMDLDHKIDSKCLYIMDQLAEIKAEQKIGGVVQTRVSKVEDHLSSLTMECKKEDYDNMKPKKNEQDGPTDDYVEVISDPKDDTNPKKMGSAKRKRGRPRKKQEAEDPLVQQFSTQKIAEQKEDYDNMKPKKNEQDGPTDDYVEVISDPKDDTNPKKMGSAKRKRGRPRKKQEAEDPLVQQFSTQKIAEQVQKKTGRVSKPGPHQKSPFKKI